MSLLAAKPTGDARERKRRSARHGLLTRSPVSSVPASVGHGAQAIARSRFQAMADHSAQARQSAQIQAMADQSPRQALEQLSGGRSEEKRRGMTAMLPTLAPYSGGRRADTKTPRITTSVQRYAEGARPEAYRENSVHCWQ